MVVIHGNQAIITNWDEAIVVSGSGLMTHFYTKANTTVIKMLTFLDFFQKEASLLVCVNHTLVQASAWMPLYSASAIKGLLIFCAVTIRIKGKCCSVRHRPGE